MTKLRNYYLPLFLTSVLLITTGFLWLGVNDASAVAITQVQSRIGGNGFGGTSYPIAFTGNGGNNNAGDILVAVIKWTSPVGKVTAITSVSDPTNGTWTLDATSKADKSIASDYGHMYTQIAYIASAAAHANVTVTVNWDANSTVVNVVSLYELTAGTLFGTNSSTGTSNTASAGSLTPTVNGAYGIATTLLHNGGVTQCTKGTGWDTLDENTGGGSASECLEVVAQGTAAALSGTFTMSTSQDWAASMIFFQPSASVVTTCANALTSVVLVCGGSTIIKNGSITIK